MDRALDMAAAHELPVTPVSSVREGDRDPLLRRTAAEDIPSTVADTVEEMVGESVGRIAVIVDPSRRG
ncbi:hypothetical protein NL365_27980, partial [Klebsiella pneumoniae]|nr:hypothetical protein [Klebsiella pneumoniae]